MVCITGVLAFLTAWVVHWLWWRWSRPQQTAQRLIQILSAVVTGVVLGQMVLEDIPSLCSPGEWFLAWLVGISLSASYVMTYPVMEVVSPTHLLIELLDRHRQNGMTREEIHLLLNEEILVHPRVADLLREGLAVATPQGIFPTAKGRGLARLFAVWRRVLRAPLGG